MQSTEVAPLDDTTLQKAMDEAVDWNEGILRRDGLLVRSVLPQFFAPIVRLCIRFCLRFGTKPYTGWMTGTDMFPKTRFLSRIEDGLKHGPYLEWHENGQKTMEGAHFEDKKFGPTTTWYSNGQKQSEGTYSKGGAAHGPWTDWYESGERRETGTMKDGLVMAVTAWKPNGEKCLVTNVVNGNGSWMRYEGTQSHRETYKDGILVED